MRDDLRSAFRSFRSAPTFTIVALIVLALGIGATTAIFSVVDAVVLRGLPFDEHDRLVALGERRPLPPGEQGLRDPRAISSAAPQNYMDWAAKQQVFESIAAIGGGRFTLREPGAEPEDLPVHRVTAGFFDVLRVRPAIGRTFTPDNEVDGRDRVVILSDSLWRRRFGADPGILGTTIPLEGSRYEVIGVMPPEFAYPVGSLRPTAIWVPYVVPPDERVRNPHQFDFYLQTIARLKPDVTIEQAQAQMDQIALALQQAYPDWNKDRTVGVRPLRDHLVGARTRSWMLMLLAAVAIVLVIACANVANLLLARARAREREIGIRAALGAGRWRLIRQMMVESFVLSIGGTFIAIALAWWTVAVLRSAMPENVPRVAHIGLDMRVLAAATALALLTGLLFGIVPALQLSRPDLTNALKEGTRGAGTRIARRRMRSALVVVEVALAVVLLVGAALFIGSFAALMRIDPGFDSAQVLTAGVYPRSDSRANQDVAAKMQAFNDMLERMVAIPGVEHAAVIQGGMPLGGSMSTTTLEVPGRAVEGDKSISIRRVSPEYHRALRIPLRAGRFLEDGDGKDAPQVMLLNESAAKTYFAGEDPIGRVAKVSGTDRTIVGIVGDIYQSSLETEPLTEAYVPLAQQPVFSGELVIRTTGDPYAVLPQVKAAALAVLPDVPLRNVRTMEEIIAGRVAQRKLNMLLLGLFGLLGLVISAAGIYGVMAYVVSQRTHELGVRMALGATRGRIIGMVVRNSLMLVAAGLAIGGVGAWYLSETAKAFLFGLEAHDVRAYAAAIVVLALTAVVASAVPARRAAGVDPMVALRAE